MPSSALFPARWRSVKLARDYNSAHRGSSQQVKQRDIDRIKTDLGEECTTFFTDALSEEPCL